MSSLPGGHQELLDLSVGQKVFYATIYNRVSSLKRRSLEFRECAASRRHTVYMAPFLFNGTGEQCQLAQRAVVNRLRDMALYHLLRTLFHRTIPVHRSPRRASDDMRRGMRLSPMTFVTYLL